MPNAPKANDSGTFGVGSNDVNTGSPQPTGLLKSSRRMAWVYHPNWPWAYFPTGNFLDFDSIILNVQAIL